MTENNLKDHLDIRELEDYVAGHLGKGEIAAVEGHLGECPLCSLEVKRIRRFEEIDTDEALAEKADWASARFKLERAFKEEIAPSIIDTKYEGREVRPRGFISKWLAPLAAAAAVVVMFVYIERARVPGTSIFDAGPMRGEGVFDYMISLESPIGNIDSNPERFEWRSEMDSDYYKLEIFTSDLEQVYEKDNIEASSWSVIDSVQALFEPGTFYLWNVKGYKGLEREISSPNAWFKIEPR